ncbi:MAG: hypothetical protein P1U87_18675 [Verrucomicrobiales bacterium]|nr:hypothetical protein [Verrucomicrobiales bacterium]
MKLFHPFLPLPPGAMHGDKRPKGDGLTAGQARSVKTTGRKKQTPGSSRRMQA